MRYIGERREGTPKRGDARRTGILAASPYILAASRCTGEQTPSQVCGIPVR